MKKNIPTFAIIAVLCFLACGLSNAKPTDNEGSPLKDKDVAQKFLSQVLSNKPGSGYDVCYMDSSITCSCPDGYYCCIKGDPSCLGACCPAGSYCTPDGRGCY